MNKLIAALLVSLSLLACGGGGSEPVPPHQQLVGEVFDVASEWPTAELKSTFVYTGKLTTSRAAQAAGKQNILDLLFMSSPDAEQTLVQYTKDNSDLLVPGVRVLIDDEVFWDTADPNDGIEALQAQLDALSRSATMIRRYIPQASIGVTITPYATFARPNTLEYIKKLIPLVDWVATDPYWLGDKANIQALHDWSRTFNTLAKTANPKVETWFIAQAFKMPSWDLTTFNGFIAEELTYAAGYDGVLFFGWQFVSEIDMAAAGMNFTPETKLLYKKYLK
jgi:hypothetical protein